MLYYCVAYDISGHRLRRRVAKWCRLAGLRRLQKSVFLGPSPKEKLRELQQRVQAEITATDRFVIIPLNHDAMSRLLLLGELPPALLVKRPSQYF
jgi:CRISPR-associated protein Cas2